MREPSLDRLTGACSRHLAATRPGFLGAALGPALIGLAAASRIGAVDYLSAATSLVGVLAAHAGINVLNDVYDHHAGCDAINDDRIFPFTGGSRLIQNGVLSAVQMARLGWSLMVLAALAGVMLIPAGGSALIAIGLVGLGIGWAYSAPPLRLSARGLGEICVGVGFGLLIPVGAALVQTGCLEPLAAWAGGSFAFLITAVLFVNQFPDVRSDAATGKRNLVVRLGPARAWWIYPILVLLAYGTLLLGARLGVLPVTCLLAFASVPLHATAVLQLRKAISGHCALVQPIKLTLAGTLTHALLMAGGLLL